MTSNRLEAAIRAGCERVHGKGKCSYSNCSYLRPCVDEQMVRIALRAFLSLPPSDEEVEAVARSMNGGSVLDEPDDAVGISVGYPANDKINIRSNARRALQASTEYRMKEIGE